MRFSVYESSPLLVQVPLQAHMLSTDPLFYSTYNYPCKQLCTHIFFRISQAALAAQSNENIRWYSACADNKSSISCLGEGLLTLPMCCIHTDVGGQGLLSCSVCWYLKELACGPVSVYVSWQCLHVGVPLSSSGSFPFYLSCQAQIF